MESRPCDGKVWRRRICSLCHKTFVSCETSSADMRMPKETHSRHRARDPKSKPGQSSPIRGDGAHLQGIW
jgi:hypothetical protein